MVHPDGTGKYGVSVGFNVKGSRKMKLTSRIDKHDMTDEDIKNRFVTPALNRAGWEACYVK